jgi:hypothetical protein
MLERLVHPTLPVQTLKGNGLAEPLASWLPRMPEPLNNSEDWSAVEV